MMIYAFDRDSLFFVLYKVHHSDALREIKKCVHTHLMSTMCVCVDKSLDNGETKLNDFFF